MDYLIIKIKNKFGRFMQEESGMGVIEVVLIVLVLVGLALVFKSEINSIASGIFGTIKSQVKKF